MSCSGQSNGAIDITVSGGTAPYTYLWSNAETTEDISGLIAGNYSVTITDAKGCSLPANFTVSQPDPLTVSGLIIDVLCNGGNNGSVDITVSGGTQPYSFVWSNGETTEDISGLTAGNYSVTITDANACILLSPDFTVNEPLAPLSLSETIAHVSCNGGNDGQILINASGGTSPYTYSIDTGANYYDNGGIFNTLTAGNYNLAVKDANACELAGGAQTITEPPALVISDITTTQATCNNSTADGSIVITANGGSPAYIYSVDGGLSWQANADFNNLLAGSYNIMLKDVNSCTVDSVILLESKYKVIAEAGPDQSICPGEGTNLQGSGGSSYQWLPTSGLSDPSIAIPFASPTETSTYYLTASEGVCSDIDSVKLIVFEVPQVDAGMDTTIYKGSTIRLEASHGFDSYLWVPLNGLVSSNSERLVDAMPEITSFYKVVATTADGCISTDSLVISVIENFVIPSGFTPNGDQWNNTWVIENAWLFPDIIVRIVDRWGHEIFYSKGYGNGIEWDGTNNGKELPIGTYYYVIILNDGGNTPPITGPVTIIR